MNRAKTICWFHFDSNCVHGKKCKWPHVSPDQIDPAELYMFGSGLGSQRTVSQTMAILRERLPDIYKEYEDSCIAYVAFTVFVETDTAMRVCYYEMPVDEFESVEALEDKIGHKIWNVRYEYKRDAVKHMHVSFVDEFPYVTYLS